MATIELKEPDGPYGATIDTGVMEVTISKAYLGVTIASDSGKKLHVCLRDDDFEITES